ncbi:MAG: RNA polymerase sigma factor [Clostridia bacterium]|nr:RNA polymerase sigma factor [Clostridia bacterium]
MDKGAEYYLKYLQGDDDALVGLLREYRDGLILYINGIVGDMPTAEDIAEDTFFRLITKKPKYAKLDNASFRTWLYGVGRSIAYDRLRRDKRIVYTDLPERQADEPFEDAFFKSEIKKALHRCLLKLSPEKYELIWLSYFEEFDAKQISKITGKSEAGVYTSLSRIRAELRKLMNEEGYTNEDL